MGYLEWMEYALNRTDNPEHSSSATEGEKWGGLSANTQEIVLCLGALLRCGGAQHWASLAPLHDNLAGLNTVSGQHTAPNKNAVRRQVMYTLPIVLR